MSLLDFFFSPSAQKLEHKGDLLFEAGQWGQAKQAYERALYKFETNAVQFPNDHQRITEKIRRAKEALALEHQQNAENYLEGGYFDEARELLALAHEVSSDEQVKKEIEQKLHDIELRQRRNILEDATDYFYGLENDDEEEKENDHHELSEDISEDEEFVALCNTLPDDVGAEYRGYGRHFKTGYVALNQGDFQSALVNFKHALQDNSQPDSYIPLELATAYLNLDQMDEARTLLEDFIPYHREALPAYQLLCEIYWEQKDFSKVEVLLDSVPEKLKDTIAVVLLKGKTLYQSGNYEKAKSFYKGFLETYGWHEAIARELAKVCETLGETDIARNIYKEIIGRCTGCKSEIDPEIKDKYAELSFSTGFYSTDILEMYLSLAREKPDDAARYFDRVSRIYEAQGNSYEAGRFRHFSNQVQKDDPRKQ
jgi:tetratricopeptide (TPR) repeat protein